MLTYLALGIFALSFALIIFELYDKAVVAMTGALLMIVLGIIDPEAAILAIDFETILLLLAMMLLVNIASKSGIFEWMSVRIAAFTKGNPLAIFLLFSIITGVVSSVLDNVTTIILLVPVTIQLVKGMGRDPRPYVLGEVMLSSVGGALTLIGDPTNIIVGGYAGLNFMDFVRNLWIPVLFCAIFVTSALVFVHRKKLKPVSGNLVELFVANVIIKKVKNQFAKKVIHKDFVIATVGVLILTVLGFMFQRQLGLPTHVIAFCGAVLLALLTKKRVEIEEALHSVEWSTLLFFSGLFIMSAGVESTGVLTELSQFIVGATDNLLYLALLILWTCGLVSMVLNNVPFVTVMLPVIAGIQTQVTTGDASVLWWALTLGTCLGGNGTLVGASANVVAAGLTKKHGAEITFLYHLKYALPITIGMLMIASVYLFFRIT